MNGNVLNLGAGEEALQLRAGSALTEDLKPVPCYCL